MIRSERGILIKASKIDRGGNTGRTLIIYATNLEVNYFGTVRNRGWFCKKLLSIENLKRFFSDGIAIDFENLFEII